MFNIISHEYSVTGKFGKHLWLLYIYMYSTKRPGHMLQLFLYIMFFTCVSTPGIVECTIWEVERDCTKECKSTFINFRMDTMQFKHWKKNCTKCCTMCASLSKGQALTIGFWTCTFLAQNVVWKYLFMDVNTSMRIYQF